MNSRQKRFLRAALSAAAATGTALFVRRRLRLAEYRREVRERTEKLDEAGGWTADGYICNQDHFYRYTYRTIPASGNACGPVALFDLRHYAGHDVRFSDVLAEMDAMHRIHAPGPTVMRVMRRYCDRYLPGYREARGRSAALDAAERSRMGVFRYHEQGVPHFVPYFRVTDGTFRFFNVCDGLEDAVMPMAAFGAGHLCGGSVKLIYWE